MAINKKPVTIKDVAAHCGVGKSTVSAALSGKPVVKEKTRLMVLAAAKELGYDPAAQESARRLRMRAVGDNGIGRSKIIALLFPIDIFNNAYFLRMAEGAMEVLNRSGYGVFLSGYDDREALRLHPAFSRGEIDGIIESYSPLSKPGSMKLLAANPGFGDKPVISLMRPISKCHAVVSDTFQGGYKIVNRLLALGHRKFLFVMCGGDDESPAAYLEKRWNKPNKDKWRGMAAALEENGLSAEERLSCLSVSVKWIDSIGLPENRVLRSKSDWEGDGVRRLLEALEADKGITAILAHNDPCAFRIWCALLDHGVRIPDDMTLAGFDDSEPVFAPEGGNLLTTVHLPLYEMGQTAGDLMIRLIEGKSNESLTSIALSPELVERASSGPPYGTC